MSVRRPFHPKWCLTPPQPKRCDTKSRSMRATPASSGACTMAANGAPRAPSQRPVPRRCTSRCAVRCRCGWRSRPMSRSSRAGRHRVAPAARRSFELRTFVRGARAAGRHSTVPRSAQLGADRWAALLAAHTREPGHKLVVNVGTALTIDALAAEGRFLGGLIVPGPALMRRSLDRGTAGVAADRGQLSRFSRTARRMPSRAGPAIAGAGASERMAQRMAATGRRRRYHPLGRAARREIAGELPFRTCSTRTWSSTASRSSPASSLTCRASLSSCC